MTAGPVAGGGERGTPQRGVGWWIATAACIALGATGLWRAWLNTDRYSCIDYYQAWVAASAVQLGETDDIYDDAERIRLEALYESKAAERFGDDIEAMQASKWAHIAYRADGLHTYSTPWLYALVGLGSVGDYDVDVVRFQRASLLLVVLACAWMCRRLGYSAGPTSIALGALAYLYEPLLSDVAVGNVNRLLLAGLVAALACGTGARGAARHLAAGALFCAAVVFKPSGALVVLMLGLAWWVRGDRRRLGLTVAGGTIGAALAVAASSLFFGTIDVWRRWVEQLPLLAGKHNPASEEGNMAPQRLIQESTGEGTLPWPPAGVVVAVLVAAVIVALLVARRRRDRAPGGVTVDLAMLGLGGVVTVLATPLTWLHYYVLVVPLVLCLLRPRRGASRVETLLAAATAVALCWGPLLALYALATDTTLADDALSAGRMARVTTATVVLFLLALVDLGRGGDQP